VIADQNRLARDSIYPLEGIALEASSRWLHCEYVDPWQSFFKDFGRQVIEHVSITEY